VGCAFALATSATPVGIWLRLESSAGRLARIVSAVVTLRPDDPGRFVMELYALDEPSPDRAAARAAELERRMRREPPAPNGHSPHLRMQLRP